MLMSSMYAVVVVVGSVDLSVSWLLLKAVCKAKVKAAAASGQPMGTPRGEVRVMVSFGR